MKWFKIIPNLSSIFLFQNFSSISTENEITQRIYRSTFPKLNIKFLRQPMEYHTTIPSYILSYQNSKYFYSKIFFSILTKNEIIQRISIRDFLY